MTELKALVKEKLATLPEKNVVIKGIAAGKRAVVSGTAKVVNTPEEAAFLNKGDIFITENLAHVKWHTDWKILQTLKLASAIVTEKGGVSSHAATISRDYNIPCVVGAENATQVMQTGKAYTVDGVNGVIYEGNMKLSSDETADLDNQMRMVNLRVDQLERLLWYYVRASGKRAIE